MKLFLYIIPSIFANNQLDIKRSEALIRNENYNISVFVSLFICCTLIVYLYLRYYKKLLRVLSSAISYSASQQIRREGFSFFRSFSVSLFAIYIISISIFFTDLSIYMGWFKHFSSELITSFTILAMLVVIIAKGTLSYLLGLITKEKGVNEDAFFQYTLSIFSVGLIMLIFCLLVHYSNIPFTYLIPVGIGFPILVFALRMIKILAFGYLQFGFSVFHLVLYLCAVELIPLVIFVKIITGG